MAISRIAPAVLVASLLLAAGDQVVRLTAEPNGETTQVEFTVVSPAPIE